MWSLGNVAITSSLHHCYCMFYVYIYSYGWFPWLPDWVGLSPLWNVCVPLLLHLVSYGIQRLLFEVLSFTSSLCHTCLGFIMRGRGGGVYVSSVLLLGGVALSYGCCSGLGPALSIIALLVQVKYPSRKETFPQCLLSV